MSWLRNSQLTSSFSTKRSNESLPNNCDPEACIESFKKHWQQAYEIIERTHPPKGYPIHDDVLGVVNHMGQMATLLVVELEKSTPSSGSSSPTPCLEHLLSETILHRLFEWSQHTGRFLHMVKQEQMKLYEKLVYKAGQSLLVHEPFVRPLLRLLSSCCNDTLPFDQEKQLVQLLRQLCISLTQNKQLLDLFFTDKTDNAPSSFILFTLLVPYFYRPGPLGQQARDAILLCMSISKHNDALGAFIAEQSHVCPMLATILSGLYSEVPRKLEIESEDWHRLTTDDVNELEDLTLFVNTLECCNAIVQDAHNLVSDKLVDLISNGFLLPVMGTALLQDSIRISWTNTSKSKSDRQASDLLQANTEEELITATAYFELFLRSTTDPGLRPSLCSFLMRDSYDDKRILTTLIQRIRPESSPKLRVVTLALLETLVSLDSEEVMSELVFKYLTPCNHVMHSQRARLRDVDTFLPSALKLLALAPAMCQQTPKAISPPPPATQGNPVYGLRPEESLYNNYHAYLCDARSRIQNCVRGCQNWRFRYDGESPPADEDFSLGGDSSGYESLIAKNSPPRVNLEENGHPLSNGDHPESVANGEPEKVEEVQQRLSEPEEKVTTTTTTIDTGGNIGPFLDSLFHLVENLGNLSLPEILRVTGIVSRLSIYPHPLLTSLLLNHNLVFQPSIRSLFQALRSLKQSLESSLSKTPGAEDVLSNARTFLLHREERLASMRKTAVETPKRPESFTRGDSKRRSFSSALSSVLRMAMPTTDAVMENETRSGYKYVRGRAGSGQDPVMWNKAVCAIIVDEWLRELAAIAQEQMLQAVS